MIVPHLGGALMKHNPLTEFTARTLLATLNEVRELENYAERVRVMVHALAKEHGIAVPTPCPSCPSKA